MEMIENETSLLNENEREQTMDLQDVAIKLKKRNKILFSKDSECLKELVSLIGKQKRRTLVLWAFECGRVPLEIFEDEYPDELRPRRAFDICEQWAQGNVKMAKAKQAILDCHNVCKEIDNEYYIALCHAIGQGLSTIHVKEHAIGLALYELTSIVLRSPQDYQEAVERKIRRYVDTLKYFQKNVDELDYKWADFLLKDEA